MKEKENAIQRQPERVNVDNAFVIEDDIMRRYRLVAELLNLTATLPDAQDWLLGQIDTLQKMLTLYSNGSPVHIIDQEALSESVAAMVDLFCLKAREESAYPFIISFDPTVLSDENTTYIWQTNRANCIPQTVVLTGPLDPNRYPKQSINRFLTPNKNTQNGAGKQAEQQLGEVLTAINRIIESGVPLEKIRFALVDGSVLSGNSILEFLTALNLPPECSISVFTGSTTEKGIRALEQRTIQVFPVSVIEGKPYATLSVSDCVPSFGGRMLGVSTDDQSVPLTVEKGSVQVPIGMDAFQGGQPHLVDLNPFDPDSFPADDHLLRELNRWSYQTAQGIWQWLELAHNGPLSWETVLKATNGTVKVFLPGRNQMTMPDSQTVPESPLESVYASAQFRY